MQSHFRRLAGWRARRVYYATDRELAYLLWDALDAAGVDGHKRGTVLLAMAEQIDKQAKVYTRAFGPDPLPEEGGRDMAEALASEALAVWWLAASEIEAAYDGPEALTLSSIADANGWPSPWPEARPFLERLCDTGDLSRRAQLVDEMCTAVTPVIGGQAAETLHVMARVYRGMTRKAVGCQ